MIVVRSMNTNFESTKEREDTRNKTNGTRRRERRVRVESGTRRPVDVLVVLCHLWIPCFSQVLVGFSSV